MYVALLMIQEMLQIHHIISQADERCSLDEQCSVALISSGSV